MMHLIIGLVVGANLGVLLLSLCAAADDGPVTDLWYPATVQDALRALRDHGVKPGPRPQEKEKGISSRVAGVPEDVTYVAN
jgi:hypothetical protein